MKQLFYFTAINPIAVEHLKNSMINPINDSIVDKYLNETEKNKYDNSSEDIFAWGAVPGEGNIRTWKKMNSEDYILTVCKKNGSQYYRFISQVIEKRKDAQLAEAIWGRNEAGQTWEYIYFLTKPKEIDVKVSSLSNVLKSRHQGFLGCGKDTISGINSQYGSVENFIKEKFQSSSSNQANAKWSDFELRESMVAYLWMLDKERNEEQYTKSHLYQQLSNTSLNQRTLKSIEYGMQNISYVLNQNGYKWINGLAPMSGVGSKNYEILLGYYHELTSNSSDYVPSIPEATEKDVHLRKNAAITGKKAEDIFEESANEIYGWNVVNVSDTHGLGYDFRCDSPELFIEVKGCRNDIESIRMTKKEWKEAEEKQDKYILIIVEKIEGEEAALLSRINNPFEKFKNKKVEYQSITIEYHIKKNDLLEEIG